MKYTYNGITFDNIDINTYSNVGAKLKHHSLTTINDNDNLLPYSVVDALFINWNGANIKNTIGTINKINNTPDLIKYLIELHDKIKYLENMLNDINNNKTYPISFELTNLSNNGDTYVSKNATKEIPNKLNIIPNQYYNLPTSIEVIGCEYVYFKTTGEVHLFNVSTDTEKVIIRASAIIKTFIINYDNLNNINITLSSNKPTSITYEITEDNPKTFTITAKNKYYIEGLSTNINNCNYSFNLNDTNKIATVKLWSATNNIYLPSVKLYYKILLNNITLNNCSASYNNEYKLYNENDTIQISLIPYESYFITDDSIEISGCTYSLSNNILTLSNFSSETPTITINAIRTSNEYVFIGYDKNSSNGYPNDDSIQSIINGTYYNNDDEELINNESNIIINTLTNYNSISDNNYYYNNVVINNIKNIINNITLNVNTILGKYSNKTQYILIPQSYKIVSIKDDLNYELLNKLFIKTSTTTIDNIIYNIYKTYDTIDFGLNIKITIEKLN